MTRAGLVQRPLARDFYRAIVRTSKTPNPVGWSLVRRVDQAQPGDVIAWEKPAEVRSDNTGHVGFLALPPHPVPRRPGHFLVRFIDSTSLYHDDDTREPGNRSGFGFGTILLIADEAGGPAAYGWVGLRSPRIFWTAMAIGRPTE